MGEVFEQTTNFVNPDKGEIELWSLTVEDGLTPKSERYNREFLVKKNANFKKVRPGDIVYNPMNMTLGAVGYNGMLKNVAVSGYYITMFVKTGYDSYYINTWLKSPQAISLYKTFATGSLIEKQRVQFSTLSIIPTVFPEYEEQKRIGCYFNNLDSLITFHHRKSNLFNKTCRNAWEQRKLNEVAEKICVGFVGTCEKFYTDESGVPMYRTGNLNGLSLNRDDLKYVTNEFHQHNQKSQLKAGDILIARHGDSGKAVNYESSEEANCLNIVIIRPDFKKSNYKFLTNCINSPECQKHIKSLSAGSTQAVINTSEIEKLGVVMPTNIDEQNRIARYFSNLDNLITLHQRKCNQLQIIRKYMLKNIFL